MQITEAKLLRAISHEVRTPLATIRTLISSTLKKYKMDESMRNRLIQIDNECNEQIDRFGLIFNAAELVSNEVPSFNNLAKINLAEISVESGDMVVCDRDGVVVVPFLQIDEVLDKLERLKTAEANVETKIQSGLTEPEYLEDLMTSDKIVYLD